jgi:hypothetical protein
VPETAENIKLCFTNGDGGYENNKGANFELRIKGLKQPGDPQAQGPTINPRWEGRRCLRDLDKDRFCLNPSIPLPNAHLSSLPPLLHPADKGGGEGGAT